MIDLVIDARRKDLGGFEVGRILPFAKRRMVGPFIFLDHMGPAAFAPGEGINVRPHPHIGLSTVTYLFEGEILHRDSLGSTQAIRPGEVNWMTAGQGIVHSERTDPTLLSQSRRAHGLQAWVALPEADEEIEPAFAHHPEADLPSYETGGLWARLIAGSAYGVAAKVKTHSPLYYIHWELKAGTRCAPPEGYPENALYVVRGEIEVEGRTFHAGQMLVLSGNQRPTVTAITDATVAALGGEPVGPRHIWWNLVSSSSERIEQAKADWAAGRMTLPPGDDQEFIPLPEDLPPPAAQPL
ncbi:pirin family protein [Caulobacter sp. S45]|jgi:redox-sensitive bicupin YhaK (pirin superfamily)|uniref:pirin family protein n=1 Tax=Caulobacter sp. S45 TaxID=1641861 RepID=UPI00131A6417|nr:pirin family protein [Caulobacter sp. S45]